MTRAECIAELRLRRDACQRTAEIHPCELARARSEARALVYNSIAFYLEDSAVEHVVSHINDRFQSRRDGSVSRARDDALRNALELVGQIAGEP